MVHTDIKVLDTHLDYNILLGRSYMYAMSAITSSIFRIMMFPHEDRIIIVDQLMHTEKHPLTNTDMVLPYVDTATDGLVQYQEYGLGQFKPSSILGSFLGDPPIIPEVSLDATRAMVCMMSTSSTKVSQDTESSSNDTEASATATSIVYATSQTPFLYPPPGFVS